jgi:tetratricopeptide (TPR) repeat protein
MQKIIDEDPSDCDALIFFADEALLNGDIDQGIFQFRQVIHLEPHKDRAYVALAKLYMAQGNESMARQILQECIQNNNSSAAKIMLSQLFEKNNQLEDAIQQIRSVPGIYSSRLELFKTLIRLEIKNRNFSQVQKDLTNALEVEPYKEFSIVALSKFFVLQGQFDDSHDLLDNYLKSDDQNPLFLEQKISVFIAQKDFANAFAYIDKQIVDKSLQYYLKGNILWAQKNIDDASVMYEKSLEMKNNRYVLMKLLHVYTQSEQYDNAIERALPYMKAHESDFRLAFLLGYLYEHVNEYDLALKFYQLALEKNPQFFPAMNNLAYLYANHFPTKKNLQSALSLIKQRGFSLDTQFLDTLGWVHVQMGHPKKAIALLKHVVSRPDPSPLACYHLGVAYMHDGQTQLAREWLNKSVNTDVHFPEKQMARKLLQEIAG